MTYLYRCTTSKCRARRTLPKHIEEYRNRPVCACGGNLHRDKWQRGYDRKRACRCGEVHYPHNTSHTGCAHYTGTRDLQHESLLEELGASPVIEHKGKVPF